VKCEQNRKAEESPEKITKNFFGIIDEKIGAAFVKSVVLRQY
jgi:hypothetical protein